MAVTVPLDRIDQLVLQAILDTVAIIEHWSFSSTSAS
jgi:hypothetical protein